MGYTILLSQIDFHRESFISPENKIPSYEYCGTKYHIGGGGPLVEVFIHKEHSFENKLVTKNT